MSNPPVLNYAPPSGDSSRRGRGALAVAATLFFPSLGHLLAGNRRRALFWFILVFGFMTLAFLLAASPSLVPFAAGLLIISLGLNLAVLIDAYLTGRRSQNRMLGHPVRRYIAAVLVIVATVFLAPSTLLMIPYRRYVLETFSIPNASMSPAIQPGDRIVVHKNIPIRRFDIIVFEEPAQGTKYVKRLVGLPGEKVEFKQGQLHINNSPVSHPPEFGLLRSPPGMLGRGVDGGAVTLGGDEHFVVGDNSANSFDSRFFADTFPGHQPGAIPRNKIIGRATWIYWPGNRFKRLDR